MNGELLKKLRKERSMTQAALAEKLGLDKSSVAKYESADVTPSSDILMKLADIFGVSVDYLLGRVDSPREEVPVALYAPKGYDKLTPEEREQIERLVDMFARDR